jgi:hypothetical protein
MVSPFVRIALGRNGELHIEAYDIEATLNGSYGLAQDNTRNLRIALERLDKLGDHLVIDGITGNLYARALQIQGVQPKRFWNRQCDRFHYAYRIETPFLKIVNDLELIFEVGFEILDLVNLANDSFQILDVAARLRDLRLGAINLAIDPRQHPETHARGEQNYQRSNRTLNLEGIVTLIGANRK